MAYRISSFEDAVAIATLETPLNGLFGVEMAEAIDELTAVGA
jgi:hypothetical protein